MENVMIYLFTMIITYFILNQLLHNFTMKLNVWFHLIICLLCMYLAKQHLITYFIFIVLYIIGYIDYKTMYIFDVFLLIYLFLITIYAIHHPIRLTQMWISFGTISCMNLLNIDKERIGVGDIYLLYASSIYFSIMDLSLVMFIACCLAFIYILILKKRSEYIPFAPFLCIGIILMLL